MATVAFESVGKTYPNGHVALSDVSVAIADGERLVVVGPSGCGKSTLLRILAGLEAATEGTIRIGGRVVNELSPQERNVAMVFQDYALYPHKTVRGNLEFPLRMRRMPRDERDRRVEQAAALLRLSEKLERTPRELSGGERQRVAMGRALVREPAVFLLDEPLSNLDAKLRVEVRGEIGELQRRTRTTMLYVTHDQVEAMTLGDRVMVLDRGRVQQVAAPAELYERPANAFVAGFVGNPPMNLVKTRVAAAGGGFAMRLGEGTVALDGAAGGRLAGREITVGLRPEAVRLAGEGVPATVEQVERLGHETLALVRAGEADDAPRIWLRTAADAALDLGTRVTIAIDPAKLHFFDESGAAMR